jgi:D-xylose transport system permease protein
VRGLVLVLTDGRSLMVERADTLAQMLAFESTRVPLFWPLLMLAAMLLAVGAFRRAPLPIASALVLAALAGLAGRAFTVAAPVVYLAAFTAIVWAVLRFTVIGRRIYAVGGNAEAARLSGINVHAYKLGAFVLSSVAAGFAGILFGCRLGAINPTALQGSELTVIAAAILGGTSLFGGAGSVVKTVVGALLLFTLTNGFNVLNLGASYQGLIEGVVVIAAAAIYTVGGKRARRPARPRAEAGA